MDYSVIAEPRPIIPWIGGKRRLAKHILPCFPAHKCYVEVFCGAAALFFMKEESEVEILNDLNGDLVNLYRVVRYHLQEFMQHFKWALTSREIFQWTKDTPPDTLTDIQRAARFYYLQRLAFGAKVDSQTFGTATTARGRLNLLRMEEDLSAVHLRLHQVSIERLDWATCVARYDRPHTFFYMDPPYYGTAGYGVDFELGQYDRIAALLHSMHGKALVSVNDIPEMHHAFQGLPMERLSTRYTVGSSAASRRPVGELLIRNW